MRRRRGEEGEGEGRREKVGSSKGEKEGDRKCEVGREGGRKRRRRGMWGEGKWGGEWGSGVESRSGGVDGRGKEKGRGE